MRSASPSTMLLPARVAIGLENRPLTETPSGESRLAGMDVLRGGAMLLGVFIHAAISYMPSNLLDLHWGIREERTSPIIDAMFWWVHACRLPLFFVIAGFFAAMVLATKGAHGFVNHRLKRLLLPFAVGLAAMLPPTYLYFWACDLLTGNISDPSIFSLEFAPETFRNLCGPLHLWFLQELMILSAIFVGIRLASGGRKPPELGTLLNAAEPQCRLSLRERTSFRGAKGDFHATHNFSADAVELQTSVTNRGAYAPRSPWTIGLSLLAPLALALPTVLMLWRDCRPLMAHQNSFIPDGMRLLYYGYFFAIGAGLYRHRKTLTEIFAWPLTHLTLSLPAGVVMLTLVPGYLHGSLDSVERLLFAASASWLVWLSIFGFLGLALSCFQGRHPLANYLADASYWVYLFHLPIVCLLQLDLSDVDWLPEVKCVLVVGMTVALGLATYQTLVRYTFIGTCLHGERSRLVNSAPPLPPTARKAA